MGEMLNDGSILPHFLASTNTSLPEDMGQLSNHQLRFGEVQSIIYPNDPESSSKKFIEYKVLVQHKSSNGAISYREYNNCVLINPMAGLADKLHYTLRFEDSKKNKATNGLGKGSKVLIACINGDESNAIILGGLRDSADATEEGDKSVDLGHHFHFNFNGIDGSINKNGELSITYQGATNIDGSLQSSVSNNNVGTLINFLKDGTFKIAGPGTKQSILLDNTQNTTSMISNQDFLMQSSHGPIVINAFKDISMLSTGVKVGDATNAWMLGTVYRNAESTMNLQIIPELTALTAMFAAAGAALSSAATLHLIPVAGPILGSPLIGVAGANLTTAGPLFQAVAQAITAFEQQAATYLSKKNLND